MKTMKPGSLLLALGLALPGVVVAAQSGSGEVSLASGQVESFDSLSANTGGSNALPTGWYISETGTGGAADGKYVGNDGSSNGGNVYSYGSSGSSERALGSITSSSVKPIIGAQLLNDTGAPMVDLQVSYTGEQWRRGNSAATDKLQFQYSADATSLTNGNWVDVPDLDFESPTSAPNDTKLDGNASANRRETTGTIQGLNLANNATVWVRWFDYDVSGNDDGLAIDDVVFGTPVDNPPELIASFPENGDDDFPSNGSLILTFSEPVAVTGDWFTLACSVSGTFTPSNSTVSGGPIAFFITPDGGLDDNEACTLDFDISLVVDLDGDPDELINPGTIHFTTVEPPPNEPPSILSTVPTQNSSNFPAAGSLKVFFSEPVTIAPGAFTLACSATTGITLTPFPNNGGADYSIDTGTALEAGDACDFGIVASLIHDLDGAELDAGALIHFTVADLANFDSYYERVNLSSAEQLRCSLHETIHGHQKYPYSGAAPNTWTILEAAQQDPNNPNKIIDVYRNRSYTKVSDRDGIGSGITYNREHTWPNSLGFANNGLAAYTDTHMLWLSDKDQNAKRGNKPLATCTQASGCLELSTEYNNGVGGGSGTYPGNSNWYQTPDGSNGSFETWDHRKGELARAMFYMAIRYEGRTEDESNDGGKIPDLELTDTRSLIAITPNTAPKAYMGLRSDLLFWHSFDPPDAEEVDRNTFIQSYQGNRNPFVDHPEWVSLDLFTSAWPPAGCVLNEAPPTVVADSYATAIDAPLSVPAGNGVLANDHDPEGAPMTAQRVASTSHGTVTLAGNGSFSYTPATGYCGTDTFTYRASDGVRWSTTNATVTISVGSNCGEPGPELFRDGFED